MFKGIMKSLGGKEQESAPPVEIPTTPKSPDFNIKPGRAYVLIGGNSEDMTTNCPSCGSPYEGPCQPNCASCSTQRKIFYADITNGEILSSLPIQKVNENASLVLPNKDIVNLGDYARVDRIIASEINAKFNLQSNVVIGKNIKIGVAPRIGQMIIADGGTAHIGDRALIDRMIVGNNVGPVTFGGKCEVQQVLSVGNFTYQAGFNFRAREQRQLGYKELLELTSKALG